MKRVSTISRTVELCLRFVGAWPDSAYANLHLLSYMTSIAIVQYCQYAYVHAHFQLSNFTVLIDCLSLTLAYTLTFIKLFVLWWNRRIFLYLLRTMEHDWRQCDCNDSYMSTMMNMADVSSRFANVLFSINVFVAFSLSIGEHFLQSMNEDNRFANSTRELPIKMQFPFDVSKSPIFECFLIGQFLYDTLIACVVGMVNALLVSLILHVSGQIDIMRQDLAEISNSKSNPDTFLTIIRGLIRKHQRIIILAENIENLFSAIALMQILWNTIVICCTGFVIIITIDNDVGVTGLIKSVSYYIDITLEAFLFCFAGEFLSAKSKSISDALYELLWYNLSPSDSRILLLMILRSQKRLTITAGKVMDLTLEGFTSIMKVSVSYISVLNAMY